MEATMTKFLLIGALVLGASEASAEKPLQCKTCFFSHEEDAGMNKFCFYDCGGSMAVITVKAYKICPISIHQ
jgi:hypothetical protein